MLSVALKEWAVVCDLLLEGGLAILLRKGGIHEAGGPGVFELEHPRFLLFPSWAHQKPEMMKEGLRGRVRVLAEPAEVPLRGMAEVGKVWRVRSREAFDRLDDLHCWSKEQIDMRFNYKPENPLYVMAVRAYALDRVRTIANGPEYAGCKSWVPLRPADEVDEAGGTAALEAEAFGEVVKRVEAALGGSRRED